MRPIIISLLLFCYLIVNSQVTFEEIIAPVDFNMTAARKSPTGEYFVQAYNDRSSIYSSPDGTHWTKVTLPETMTLDEIQFYNDGTPLLKDDNNAHLIRRNGTWKTMNMTGGNNDITASFIKSDTLFIFQENTFGYSLNKGSSFTPLFSPSIEISEHTAHLWKLNNHFVLHHSLGASDYVSVFTMTGQRVKYTQLESGSYVFVYNSCGQVLLADYDTYYLYKEANNQLLHGQTDDILLLNTNEYEMTSVNGNYFLREGNTIYKSDGCEFNWEVFAQHDQIATLQNYWANENEEFFLWNTYGNFFIEHKSGTGSWDTHQPDINYPYIYNTNEAANKYQFVTTPNAFYHKQVEENQWTQSDTIEVGFLNTEYAPNGDLYINADTVILYSQDNGTTFETINMPPIDPFDVFGNKLYVLDNYVLFFVISNFGDCFYSLNNGKDWIDAPVGFFLEDPIIKMVDNYIYFAGTDIYFEFYRINILTNEVEFEELPNLFNYWGGRTAIQDDGSYYFYAWDPANGSQEGIFRYKYGEGVQFLPELEALANIGNILFTGSSLFAFTRTNYYEWDGETLNSYTVTGLPTANITSFKITTDHHVIALMGSNRIFRTKEPISFPQHIIGTIYHDQPLDCIKDTIDASLANWKVKVENDHYFRIASSNNYGQFNFSVPKGNYTVSCQPPTSNWDLCEYAYPVTIAEHLNVTQDFLAKGLASCAELEIDFSTPRLRRCFENTYTIRIRNFGPEASVGTTLTLKLDHYFEFISSTLPHTIVNDSTITFDLGELALNETIIFQVIFRVSCDASLGAEHCLNGILNAHNLCGLTRSSYTECQENIGAVDPNDKRTFNEQGNETTRVEKGEYIYYHIRFQNTGTDTAFNVRLVDPLSPMLDLGTLEMLSSSHPYTYEITDGPDLSVTFDNILLVDSTTNEPLSHGFVKFRVKPLPEFDYGTVIPNKAGIFFDFNAPVLTNQADLKIEHAVGTKDIRDLVQFDLFPNPTQSSIQIVLPDQYIDRVDGYEIMDVMGRFLKSGHVNGNIIDVTDLLPGIYNLVLVQNGISIGQKKFAKI